VVSGALLLLLDFDLAERGGGGGVFVVGVVVVVGVGGKPS